MAWLNDSPGPNLKSSSFLVIVQVHQNCLTKQNLQHFSKISEIKGILSK